MNLEHLTKHQIVLLTLLVSFATSIATGIVTVSLMNQAPSSVTKTINQIVERTVQTVVPPTEGATVAVASTVKTVVVKDDDVAAQSIGTVQKSIIRIVGKGGTELVARGIITDAKGTGVSDEAALDASGDAEFEAILADGTRVPLTVRKQTGTSTPIAVLDVAVGTSSGFAPATIADKSKLQLGQSVLRIGGVGQDIVGSGIIASLPKKAGDPIEASVTSTTPGSVIMTLFGEVIGMVTGDSQATGADFYTMLTAPSAPAATPLKASQTLH